jgi:O-antigen ligase
MIAIPLQLHTRTPALKHAQTASAWPWKTALVLVAIFFGATHDWAASVQWRSISAGSLDGLMSRVGEGRTARQVAFLALGVFGVAGLLVRPHRTLALKLAFAYPVALFVAWSVASVFWSDDLAFSGKRIVAFVCMMLAVTAMVRHFTLQEIARLAFLCTGAILLIGVVAEFSNGFRYESFSRYRFAGTLHPNHAGINAAILMLSSLFLAKAESRKFILIALLAAVVVVMTRSRMALGGAGVASVVLIILTMTTKRAVVTGLFAMWIVALGTALYSLNLMPPVWEALLLGRSDSSVRTLTGRTEIWGFAIDKANQNPDWLLIGFGYKGFWTRENTLGVSERVGWTISEGHSAYLDTMLEVGLVGATLYALILVTGLVRWSVAARKLRSPACAFAASLLAFTIVHGLIESAMIDPTLPSLFVWGAIGAAMIRRTDEVAR